VSDVDTGPHKNTTTVVHLKKLLKQSRLTWTIILGFGLMIALLLFFWWSNVQHVSKMYQTIENSRIASVKMSLIAEMIEIARARTRLTNQMINTEDPFEKDEIGLKLDIYAGRFAQHRAQLIGTGLSKQEEDILKAQSEAIAPTLDLQRQAAEMALSDDPAVVKEAQRILVYDVYTGQGQIIDYFMQLLNLQKEIIDKATISTAQEQKTARELGASVMLFLLFTAIVGAFYVIYRSARQESELYLEKERAQITLKSIGDAVITTDKNGRIEYINPVAEKITGHLREEMQGAPINDVFKAFDESNKRWLSDCVLNFLEKGLYTAPSDDIVLYTHKNEKIDIALNLAPIKSESNETLGIIATFQDISEKKEIDRQRENQAKTDALTGILNRREFENKVTQALQLYTDNTHALCVMDLDRFKIVNDTAGHAAGDELLRQLTRNIQDTLRRSDLFARIGGDEFALFLSNIRISDAEKICEEIIEAVRNYQFFWEKNSFRVGISIGLVDIASGTQQYKHVYHAADTACYLAKHEGRDRLKLVTLDDESLHQTSSQTLWATRIHRALEQDEFVLYGQDICPVDASSSASKHQEILIRLKDRESGEIIPPGAFIPAAERYNLMPQIDEWVVRTVTEMMKASPEQSNYTVNLSGQSMGDDKFTQRILMLLESSDIDRTRLCFEITETSAIANLENAKAFLRKLQELGCLTALDDFGSGLSSFGYLRNLPINFLKIDGLFIRQISQDETSRVMVEAIHSIGRTMNLKTIAEFVEDEDILNVVRDIGIDYAQGYHLAKPVPLK
jgi:diguanylate cyclase (GGDEF)-like protein/PAS domain S-box-containing protein